MCRLLGPPGHACFKVRTLWSEHLIDIRKDEAILLFPTVFHFRKKSLIHVYGMV